ncbi:MAG: ABC transporter permease subunit [Gemmatimonas sp.]|nr:ABC transporter permease subunit [Gemmatimonas sp.]
MSALQELVAMRIRTFIREPEALFWTFGFPILLAIGLGLAFREETEPTPVPVAIEIGTAAEHYLDALSAAPEVEPILLDRAAAEQALRTGEIPLVLAGTGSVLFRYDPARPESRQARLLTDFAIQRAAGGTRPVEIAEDPERLPGGRYIDWLIPGLIGLNLMSTGMWGIGFGIVHMRQKKQLKRLIATPMRRTDFLLAQILARLAFLLFEVPPIILFAWLVFKVEISGSLLALLVVIMVGAFTFAGLGLLASSRARTVEGASGINNLVMLPMFVLSGVFFSASRFPDAMQPIINVLPLTALNDALRAVYNEGLPIGALSGELAILAVWTVLSFGLALKFYRWQ